LILCAKYAPRQAETAIIDPIDKSIPPVIIIRAIPIARIMYKDDCLNTLKTFAVVKNVSVRTIDIIMHKSTRTIATTFSCLEKNFFSVPSPF
jgi:hypothetical protein